MTPVVLAISSHVSASTVGLRAAVPALLAHGVDVWPVPSVLFGLHPGWERRRGQPLEADDLGQLIEDALAHPRASAIAWLATGHFSSPEQVETVAGLVPAIRAKAPGLKILVDPIMGDADTGLYIRPEVADALAKTLVPLADLVTPNAWEAKRLTGIAAASPAEAVAAARALGRPARGRAALVTSVRREDRIGAVYVDAGHALYAHAPERAEVPRGTGDLLAAAFLGAQLAGAEPAEALLDAVRRVAGAIEAAAAAGLPELPAAAIARGAAAPAAIEAIEA